jgi:hypothetical protein
MQGWVRPISLGKWGANKWSINPAVHGRFKERAHHERMRRTGARSAIAQTGAERREAALGHSPVGQWGHLSPLSP